MITVLGCDGTGAEAPGSDLGATARDLARAADLSAPVDATRATGRSTDGYRVGRVPSALVASDIDGDGVADLVVANQIGDERGGTVEVLLAAGRGRRAFRRLPAVPAGFGPLAVAAADLDGDGRNDVVVATKSGAAVVLLRNQGGALADRLRSDDASGLDAARVDLTLQAAVVGVHVADLDGDGRPEVIAGTADRKLHVFRRRGKGPLDFDENQVVPLAFEPSAIASSQVDGDGFLDVVAGGSAWPRLAVLASGPGGQLGPPRETPGTTRGTAYLALADLDDDHHVDAVSADWGTHPDGEGPTMLWSRDDAAFATTDARSLARRPVSGVAVADLDGKDGPDVAVTLLEAGAFGVLLHGPVVRGRELTPVPLIAVAYGATGLAAADFDVDGHVDLATALGATADLVQVVFDPLGLGEAP